MLENYLDIFLIFIIPQNNEINYSRNHHLRRRRGFHYCDCLDRIASMTTVPFNCAAWLGYSPRPINRNLTIRICSQCPDAEQARQAARELKCEICETVCFDHAKQFRNENS